MIPTGSVWRARAATLPPRSGIRALYAGADLADAYEMRLPDGASDDAPTLAHFMFSRQAPWVTALMSARDVLVAGFGLKTARQLRGRRAGSGRGAGSVVTRIGIFKVYASAAGEVVMGEDDKHLDFRVSVLIEAGAPRTRTERSVVVTTVVHCHNRLGRIYIALIAPFHRQVVRSALRRAARAGWPPAR